MTDPSEVKILVVDDTEAARYATVRLLRRAGFAVTDTPSGKMALDFIARNGFDVVILDIRLPDISGFDVCRQIKRDHPDVMVLQLSAAYVTTGDRVKGLDSGADGYLYQPVEAAELVATVRALLRIRAAEKLRASEARFRAIAETMPQIVWSVRPDGVFDYFNGRWYVYTGREPGPATEAEDSKGWCGAIHPEERASAHAGWHRSLATGEPFQTECRVRAADGSYRWHLARALPIHDAADVLVHWFGTCTDIEDIVTAREVLARSQAELEAMVAARTHEITQANEKVRSERAFSDLVVESSVDGLLAYDNELRYTLWNAAMERITGLSRAQALGREATELFPFLRGELEEAKRQALAGVTTRVRDQEYSIPMTGRQGWFDGEYTPLRSPDGEIIGAIAFIRDTTDRRAVEEQLRHAQKVEALGQLTGGVAHDFNNLLSAILGNLELIRSRVTASNPEVLSYLEHAVQGVERGAALTQRLLAFARRQDLKAGSIDIVELIGGLIDLMQRSVGPTIAVETQLPGDLWPACVDANQLELAMLNLAVNARDAMPVGGSLSVRASNQTIEPDGENMVKAGDYVCIAISDTGLGMDEATLSRAIDPFFTTKEPGKGTGLGLSMVHGLAAQSGGMLRLSSKPHGGTTAEILLPRAITEPCPVAESAKVPLAAAHRLKVLVVEDDTLVAMATQAMVEDLGHVVQTVASGACAIAFLEADRSVDLVITDYAMPGMTGGELARWIGVQRPGLPVLLATGYTDMSGGVGDDLPRISKPFRQEELTAAIHALFAGSAGARAKGGNGAKPAWH